MAILGRYLVAKKRNKQGAYNILDDKTGGDTHEHLTSFLLSIMPENADPDFISNSIRTLLDSFTGQIHCWRLANNDCLLFVNHWTLLNSLENKECLK
jgi:hypothetical protein